MEIKKICRFAYVTLFGFELLTLIIYKCIQHVKRTKENNYLIIEENTIYFQIFGNYVGYKWQFCIGVNMYKKSVHIIVCNMQK